MTISNVGEAFGLTDAGTMLGNSPTQRRQYSPARAKAIVEAAELWGRAWDGNDRAALLVKEALSTSDLFRSVTGDVLDRELLTKYNDTPAQWTQWATRASVKDFKPKKLVDILGGREALDEVPELSEYPEGVHDTDEYEISVKKFGRRFGYSWEASINDDIDELKQMPSNFAIAATVTEDKVANSLLVTSTGAPNPGFFKTANGNAPETKVLDHDNLSAAITKVSTKEDAEGEILVPGALILEVGPAQEMNARRLLNATEVRVTNGGKTTLEPNWLKGAITLVVNARLKGTAWFVLPAPTAPRPAFAVAFLRGYETPDIRKKNDQGTTVSGGALGADAGSFNEDGVYFRVRHVAGGASLLPTHTYAATGASS
ncbi:hypothetical protein ACFP63_08680 [Oerskovia jenensis]|uniref:Bacteriophage Mu GpT domain-containing protein n=1 Tax=Oerskovia jenensis TaxID=162169 RepID=A0ABS2LI70_9CELL|nr:hypothetical protein [Oerskovia jenensis]MBM7480126.1 hypothetical protein [Oerskovia jenensis]